jgi:hypothetical protein
VTYHLFRTTSTRRRRPIPPRNALIGLEKIAVCRQRSALDATSYVAAHLATHGVARRVRRRASFCSPRQVTAIALAPAANVLAYPVKRLGEIAIVGTTADHRQRVRDCRSL